MLKNGKYQNVRYDRYIVQLPSFLPTEAFSVAQVRHVGRVDARLDVSQVLGYLAPCIRIEMGFYYGSGNFAAGTNGPFRSLTVP